MSTIKQHSIGLTIALIILWFATVAGAGTERLPGVLVQAVPDLAVEAVLPKTELFALLIVALILVSFSVAAWRGWRKAGRSISGEAVMRADTEGGEADVGSEYAAGFDDLNVGSSHLGLMGR